MPSLDGALLLIEDDGVSDAVTFARDLTSLLQLPDATGVRGVVIGRFQQASKVTREHLAQIVAPQPALAGLPVLGNADFGHTNPMITFPIGGRAALEVGEQTSFDDHRTLNAPSWRRVVKERAQVRNGLKYSLVRRGLVSVDPFWWGEPDPAVVRGGWSSRGCRRSRGGTRRAARGRLSWFVSKSGMVGSGRLRTTRRGLSSRARCSRCR